MNLEKPKQLTIWNDGIYNVSNIVNMYLEKPKMIYNSG